MREGKREREREEEGVGVSLIGTRELKRLLGGHRARTQAEAV